MVDFIASSGDCKSGVAFHTIIMMIILSPAHKQDFRRALSDSR
jgi:hypothetical protein